MSGRSEKLCGHQLRRHVGTMRTGKSRRHRLLIIIIKKIGSGLKKQGEMNARGWYLGKGGTIVKGRKEGLYVLVN